MSILTCCDSFAHLCRNNCDAKITCVLGHTQTAMQKNQSKLHPVHAHVGVPGKKAHWSVRYNYAKKKETRVPSHFTSTFLHGPGY